MPESREGGGKKKHTEGVYLTNIGFTYGSVWWVTTFDITDKYNTIQGPRENQGARLC